MANTSIAQPLPSFNDIVNAPESDWRDLVAQVDGNPDFYAKARAAKVSPQALKPQRRRPRQNNRRHTAASVLSQTAPAMAEALDRVNGDDQPQTIWDIVCEAISNDQITVAPLKEQIVFQGEHHSVSLFRRRDENLVLVARNGKVTTSAPIARWGRDYTRISGGASWQLTVEAQRNYKAWAKKAQEKKAKN